MNEQQIISKIKSHINESEEKGWTDDEIEINGFIVFFSYMVDHEGIERNYVDGEIEHEWPENITVLVENVSIWDKVNDDWIFDIKIEDFNY